MVNSSETGPSGAHELLTCSTLVCAFIHHYSFISSVWMNECMDLYHLNGSVPPHTPPNSDRFLGITFTENGRAALTGPVKAGGDGVQEGVLRRDETPHHRRPGARRAASLPPLRAVALAGGGHKARQKPGRSPRASSQALEEGAEPRQPGLHGAASGRRPPSR